MEEMNSKPLIGICGSPGAGKTRLAATAPEPYFLDVEDGASSAVPKERIKVFETDKNIISSLSTQLVALKACKYFPKDRRLDVNGVSVMSVVVDSLDAVQQIHKYMVLGEEFKQWDQRKAWGKLLDAMVPVVFLMKSLPVPVIVVAHVHTSEPTYNSDNTVRKYGWKGLAFQGQLEDQIMRWFSYVLHLMVVEEGKRRCYTQETFVQDYRITAKDRHNLFKTLGSGKNHFMVTADENGYPQTKAIATIFEQHKW